MVVVKLVPDAACVKERAASCPRLVRPPWRTVLPGWMRFAYLPPTPVPLSEFLFFRHL